MYRQLFLIVVFTIALLVSTSSGQTECLDSTGYTCQEEDMECDSDLYFKIGQGKQMCKLGYFCGINPLFLEDRSVQADIGGSSFERVPQNICKEIKKIGESCDTLEPQCMPGLNCGGGNRTSSICLPYGYLFLDEDCESSYQCDDSLICDPFSKKCSPGLTDSQIQNQYQCDSDFHCSYGYYCNSTTHRCISRPSVGQLCDIDGICAEDLVCESNNNGEYVCTALFSKSEGDNCDTENQLLVGSYGLYYSTCNVASGLSCNAGTCQKFPDLTPGNCTETGCDYSTLETCVCDAANSSTGSCKSSVLRDTSSVSTCISTVNEFYACKKEHKCQDFRIAAGRPQYNIPGSCTYEHCNLCKVQTSCVNVGLDTPMTSCNTQEEFLQNYGVCAILSSDSSSIQIPSLLFIIVACIVSVFLF